MPETTAAILEQIDAVMEGWHRAKDAAEYEDFSGGLPKHELETIATRLSAAITRLAPPNSDYAQRAAALPQSTAAHTVRYLGAILLALRADVEAGYLTRFAELVHADLFSDFLEMAAELHASNYKDAAAVIAGSVLEEHLRKLATKADIEVFKDDGSPKKANSLNVELAKAEIYNRLVQKSVTAWLDLRNSAAHGHYKEYDHAQVGAFIRDVRDFMARHPA